MKKSILQCQQLQVVAIYRRRMQIEEGFRDLKSHWLGIGLELHRSRRPRSIEILLLIAALASYALCLLGLQAREAGHQRLSRATASSQARAVAVAAGAGVRTQLRGRHFPGVRELGVILWGSLSPCPSLSDFRTKEDRA